MALVELLNQWAAQINLTGHRSAEGIVRRLVLEAAALDRCLPAVPDLVDLGSGAGFPGLPLAILQPERRITLVESRLRRHHFQRAALRDLELRNVEALLGRAEVLAPQPHTAVIAQAVARPGRVLPLMRPWVSANGWILLPGGESPPEIPEVEGVELVDCVRYRVPCGGPTRTLSRLRRVEA